MSLAFGALLAAVLLLPGIVFRYLYIRSDGLRKSIDLSLLNESVFILSSALLLHVTGRWVVKVILRKDVGLEQLYLLLTGGKAPDFSVIDAGFSSFVAYILSLCVAGGLGALALQKLVLRFGLDDRFKILRIYNDWDKYISGAVLRRETGLDFDYVQVDVLVATAEGDVLYSGVLENYSLNKDQGIDRLFLSDVYRRNFSQDVAEKPPGKRKKPHYSVNEVTVAKDFDERYYRMPGNYLVIPFGEIRNLNIIYTRLEEVAPESSTVGG
ncbi:MAG: hypothetical protein AAGA31_10735 [Bacteroidota bacterium]